MEFAVESDLKQFNGNKLSDGVSATVLVGGNMGNVFPPVATLLIIHVVPTESNQGSPIGRESRQRKQMHASVLVISFVGGAHL